MTTCDIDTCELKTIGSENKCILHCKKDNYDSDRKGGRLLLFFNALNELITNHSSTTTPVHFFRIYFPDYNFNDTFDYTKTLKKINHILFDKCSFLTTEIRLDIPVCRFNDCHFHNNLNIYNSGLLHNETHVVYTNCSFHGEVYINHCDNDSYVIKNNLFRDCIFKDKIDFDGVTFLKPVFSDSEVHASTISKFIIKGSRFSEKFILNRYKIEEFRVFNTEFVSKFEFKYNFVNFFNVSNTNFSKIAEYFQSEFKMFRINKCIFEKYVGFETCKFGVEGRNDNKYVATFNHTTFLDFSNFRFTQFYCGLDFEKTNLKEPPNYLGAYIGCVNSNRETFRIIKDSFDRLGNHIEANNYFRNEMLKYREELKSTSSWSRENLIFWCNYQFSDFGQNYLLPILFLFLFAALYSLIVLGFDEGYGISTNSWYGNIVFLINNISHQILPKLFRPEKEYIGMAFISLLYTVINGSLIWLTIVALKRHTKR